MFFMEDKRNLMNDTKNLRGTDEAFLQLMELSGAGLLKLAGIPAEQAEQYEFRAVEFKQKNLQRPDVEGIPVLEAAIKRIVLEFQGYADPDIRYRTLSSMFLAYLKSKERKPVIGIIVYTQESYQKAALPLIQHFPQFPQGCEPLKEIVLTRYTEEQLLEIDPRLIVLAPFTVSKKLDTRTLTQKAQRWSTYIEQYYPTDSERKAASDLLGLLILHLFRHLGQQEVIDMLNLDLMQSRAVQQIHQAAKAEGIAEGKLEGRLEGRLEGKSEGKAENLQEIREQIIATLKQRFQQCPERIVKQLAAVDSVAQLFHLGLTAHTCESVEGFEQQLNVLN
jgi:predicted transposase YdaD